MTASLTVTSVSVVLTKVGLEDVRPIPFTTARFACAAVVLFVLAWRLGHTPWKPPPLLVIVPAALTGIVANALFFAYGLWLSTAIDISLIVGLAPILTAVWVVVLLRKSIPLSQIIALPIGFAGVVAVVGPQISTSGHGLGDLVALGIPLSFSLYLVAVTPSAARWPATILACWMMLIGLVVLTPIGLAQAWDGKDAWGPAIAPIVITGIFGTAASYTAFIWSIPRTGTTGSAIYGYLQPPIGAAAAALILQEHFGWPQALGGATILGAAILANSVRRKQPGPIVESVRAVPAATEEVN